MPTAPYPLQPALLEKSMLDRHPLWKIPLGFLILLAMIMIGAAPNIAHVVSIRRSDIYKQVVARAEMHRALREQIGEPIRPGWLAFGDYRVRGAGGVARLSIPISGPKGKATIRVVATRGLGMWWYQTLTAEVEGRAAPVELLVDRASTY